PAREQRTHIVIVVGPVGRLRPQRHCQRTYNQNPHQWLNSNSVELTSAQSTSSYPALSPGFAETNDSIFFDSVSVGLRLNARMNSSSMISPGFLPDLSIATTTWLRASLPSMVLPLTMCRACASVGSRRVSDALTESRCDAPNVFRK